MDPPPAVPPADRPESDAGGTADAAEATDASLPVGVFGQAALARAPAWAGLAAVLVLGILVHFQAIGSRFLIDDYLHSAMLAGHFPGERSVLDLYAFIDDSNRAEMEERGFLPWWSHPEITVRFFRPLSSALIWVDRTLFGEAPLPMHLHSVLWWAIGVLGARAIYRRVLGARAAWIATLVFAIAPCHAMPLSWLANRDALLSLAFGSFGLVFHLRWRDEREVRDALAAMGLFALSFLAGEYAISFLGYVMAIELVRRGDSIASRIQTLLPFVVPGTAYMVVRTALHYGTRGSAFYADPLGDPETFLWFAPRRVATNLLLSWLALDPESLGWEIPTWVLALLCAGLAVLVLVALRESFATLDARGRIGASWLLVGSVLALAPILAVVPSPRLLGATTLGIAGVVAVILDAAWFRAATTSSRRVREVAATAALGLACCHLVRGPGEAWLFGRHHHASSDRFWEQATSLAELTPDRASADVMVARGLGAAFFIPFALGPAGPPRRHRILAHANHVLVMRIDERTLDVIAARDSALFPYSEGNLFRDLRSIPHVGDVVERAGMRITFQAVEEARVLRARFEFDSDLDAVTFVNEARESHVLAEIPAVGFGSPFDSGPAPDAE